MESDPYRVFIAENLLHRTRADNVVPVYHEMIDRYPTVQALSGATYEELAGVLKPLGLTWRVEKLMGAAQNVLRHHGGRIPEDRDVLMSLPGIGDYIASAFRTFAYDRREPLVDTNTVRIICRMNGILPGDSFRRGQRVREMYLEMLGESDSREFGYSMIDLASMVCKPKKPGCERCPVSDHCITGIRNINLE